jgi:hypothetical protein
LVGGDLLRDTFKRSKYPDVILPFTVLRRIDCVLEPTKPAVLTTHGKLKGKLENLAPQLREASGFSFYNTSPYTFESLCGDAKHLAANLKNYINSFSENMREVIERFDFHNAIAKLEDSGLLFLVTERFKNIDLHPDKVSNLEMGYVFEELLRKFNEAMDENPGEHFTPREVIRLMVNLRENRRTEGFTFAILEVGYQGIRQGQLVLHSMDAFAGAIGVSDSEGKCSPEYIVCDPLTPDTISEFYAPCLREMSRQGFIEVSCKAVRERAPRIRFSTFGEMWLPVPPRKEQVEIAAHVKHSRCRYDHHIRTLRSSIGTLREYRTALISAAVTGKMDVRQEVEP